MYLNIYNYYSLLICLLTSMLFFECSRENDSQDSSHFNLEIDSISTLGGTKNESGKSVTQTLDGGYAVIGHTQSIDGDLEGKSNESYDYWLLKFNASNELEWQRTFGGTADDRGTDLIQTNDGGYAVIGKSKSGDASKKTFVYRVHDEPNEEKLLALRNGEKEVWFNTPTNKKKMLSVPYGEDPYDMVAGFLSSDEGIDSLKMLEANLPQ